MAIDLLYNSLVNSDQYVFASKFFTCSIQSRVKVSPFNQFIKFCHTRHREKRSHEQPRGGEFESPLRNRASETSKRMLFSKPFWDVRPDRRRLTPASLHSDQGVKLFLLN